MKKLTLTALVTLTVLMAGFASPAFAVRNYEGRGFQAGACAEIGTGMVLPSGQWACFFTDDAAIDSYLRGVRNGDFVSVRGFAVSGGIFVIGINGAD